MNSFMESPWPQPASMRVSVSEPDMTQLERDNLIRIFDSGWIGSGAPIVQELEAELASFLGVAHTQLVSNGSVAIMLALRAVGVSPGDEVVVPALTYAAVASSVVNVGAKPVFSDVDLDSWQMTLETLLPSVSKNTRAVIVPHSYGMVADIDPIIEYCHGRGISVIEDASEAFGAFYKTKLVGTIADVGTYSFFPNKIITAGEGGLCVTNDNKKYLEMKLLKSQGMSPKLRYVFEAPGFNFRMSALQAAVLQAQLQRYQEIYDSRMKSETRWLEILKGITVPDGEYEHTKTPWIFSFRIPGISFEQKLSICQTLANDGIETRPVFFPLPQMPAFRGFRSETSENSKRISAEGLSIPTGKHVPTDVYNRIATLVGQFREATPDA